MNFNNLYNRTDFLKFLEDQFLPDDFIINEEKYENFNFTTRYTVDATKLGTCPSMNLDVYEVIHTSTHDARVGIAQDAFRLMLHKSYNNRALVIFKQGNSSQYRFSLLQIEAEQADNSSRITRSFSNPRRYSFLLGEGAHVKTPTQFLIEKGRLTKKEGDYFNDLQERFSVEVLTKQFYKELSDWYFWALKQVEFPSKPTEEKAYNEGKELDDLIKEHKAINVIRMLTRILFVWFIKQKGLIPEELFDENELKSNILTELNPIKQTGFFSETGKDSVYYKAILQNLFFASLNCPIKPQSDDEDKRERGFRGDTNYGDDFGNDWLFRYLKYFKNPDKFVELINSKVPFLNGGLFECLDDKHNKIYIDGFTDNLPKGERLTVPDYIFFGRDENVDLSDDYGEKTPQTKQASVKGLINILKTYNFTVEENTPAEVVVALDPELLGKVFENLLASFNPETKTTARKQTGSFYTPREIVNYMVDESLIAYFKGKTSIEEEKIRPLFQYTDEEHNLTEIQVNELIEALYHCKILDPACGSGAFPMGILQKLVHLLQKVDPANIYWKTIQHEKAKLEILQALDTEDKKERESRLIEINNAFDISKNRPDYARKLYLVENCIYGVDIQPIATQISKLRFFISLVVDQNNDTNKDNNFGIIPLPNLETKFVTANSLIGVNRPKGQLSLFDTEKIEKLQEELRVCRHKIFSARTKKTKEKYRKLDKKIRMAIADELKNNGWGSEDADNLASWDPYDQNSSSPFFDPEWMFGLQRENGQLNSAEQSGYFDVVIGNPPYITYRGKEIVDISDQQLNLLISHYPNSAEYKVNSYALFTEKGLKLLKGKGILTYIIPSTILQNEYLKKIREFIIKNYHLKKIISFSNKVFEAITDSIILFVANEFDAEQVSKVTRKNNLIFSINDDYKTYIQKRWDNKDDNFVINIRTSAEESKLIEKIETESDFLEDYLVVYVGIVAKGIKRFLSNSKQNDNFKKYLQGKHIDKFELKPTELYINFVKEELHSNTNENVYLQPEKILVRKTGNRLIAVIDENQYYTDQSIYNLYKKRGGNVNLRIVTGLLNSKLLEFYFNKKMITNPDVFPYIKGIHLKRLPLKFPTSQKGTDYLISLISKIQQKKQDDENVENEIIQLDLLVYKLYKLTYDEVKIIDPEIENIISSEDYYRM